MEHKAAKLGTALAAAVLGLGIPALASAQELPQDQQDQTSDTQVTSPFILDDQTTMTSMLPVSDAIASIAAQTQTLSGMSPISADDIAVVSLNDLGLSAAQRYSLMQNADPSGMATLQQALAGVNVAETGSLAGYTKTLADHLQMLGVDPASVVAVDVANDGTVTLYYQ